MVKGFNIEKEKKAFEYKGGFGLFNINERMKRLGGRMDIESQLGKGTKIILVAPLTDWHIYLTAHEYKIVLKSCIILGQVPYA